MRVGEHRVVAYSFGTGAETVFLLNGGPGLACDYLREAHSCLIDQGYRVVAFDQLGTGAADRPTDPALWTIARYVEETETVRAALGLGKVHLLGHSWGGWLAIDYALAYPQALKSLILADTVADMVPLRPVLVQAFLRLMKKNIVTSATDSTRKAAAMALISGVTARRSWPSI